MTSESDFQMASAELSISKKLSICMACCRQLSDEIEPSMLDWESATSIVRQAREGGREGEGEGARVAQGGR